MGVGYSRGMFSDAVKNENESKKKFSKDKLDSYNNLISAIDAQLKEYEVSESYDDNLMYWGRIALDSGANDEYAPTDSGDDYEYNAINRYFKNLAPNKSEIELMGSKNYLYLQEGEIKLFNTLYNYNKEEAKEYLESLKDVLSRRATNKSVEQAQKFGEEHPVLGGIASVGTNVVMGVPAAIDNAVEGVFGDVDTYDATSRAIRSSQAMRQGGSEHIEKNYGKTASFAYNTGLSIVENAANALLFKGIGGAAGVGAKAMSSAAAANMMGMAASNAMISAADRGGSDNQIILSGIANGAAEYVFEKISLGRLFDIKGVVGWKNVLKQIGAQALVEGSEEGLTEIANILSDAMIMQGQSDNEIKRREYVLQGMSAEDATKKVFQESITQIVLSAAAGAISGGVMGGGATAIANVSHRSHMNSAGERMLKNPDAFNRMIQIGIDNNNTEAVRVATQLYTDGANINNTQAGKMVESVISDMLAKKGDIADIVNFISILDGRSPDYIGSRESIDTARAVMHFVNESATEADTRLLERSQGAITLLTAIEGDTKAWESVRSAAKADAEYRASKGFDTPQMQNAEGKMQNDGEGNIVGVRYKISEKNENNISAVTTDEVTEIVKDTNSARKKLIEYAKKIFPKSVVNTDTGNEIGISRNGIDKFLSGNITKEKYATGYKIPELVKSAKKVGEATNKKNTEGIIGYDYYENVIQIDGENYTAHIRVRKTGMGDKYYGHTISQIIDQIKIEPLARSSEENSTVHPVNALGSTDSISETDATVNTQSMQENENYSAAEQLDIPEGSEIVNNIVVDEYSKRLKAQNPRAYSNIIRMARRLGMNVRFVKGLTDSNGKVLDGLITSKGVFINADAKNPSRFVATHEFGHRMKQAAPEEWAKYQEYVINKLKNKMFDSGRTAYDVLYEETKNAYGKDDADYINEEIAVNYAGELFDNEEMLENFIREDKSLALRVRDWWYSALESMGLLSEKKKAQQMWLRAYTAAAKNVADGKVGAYTDERFKVGYTNKGNPVVMLENDIFKGKEGKPHSIIAEYIAEHIGDCYRIIESGQKVYIGEELPGEFTQSKYTTEFLRNRRKLLKAKNQSVQNLREIIEIATERKWRKNIKGKHNIDAKYGFYKYKSKIAVPKYDSQKNITDSFLYEIELVIRNDADGKKYLYDIQDIQEIKGSDEQLSSTWNTKSDIQYPSLPDNSISEDIPTVNTNSMQNTAENTQEGKKSIAGTRLSELEEKYGTIKKGAEPRRDVSLPKRTAKDNKVRHFARTAAEATTLSEETSEGVLENVADGKLSYTPISDKSAMDYAYSTLDTMGFEWVEKKVNGAITSHSFNKNTVALAEVLLQSYDEMGEQEKAQQLIIDFAAEGTRMGQSIQAISMLKKLDRNYEVSYIDKIVENLREEIIERNEKWYRRKKTDADSIEVSEELKNALREAKTEEERESIREEIYTELANQLPKTWVDRWNAWRYFAMLGNARTHVRNLFGNAFFMPMIATKNVSAKLIETMGSAISGGQMERSKTFIVPKEYRDFAAKDALAMRDELSGGGKHNPSDIIRDKQKLFPKGLEWMRVKVGDALEWEDWIFLKHHYKVALSNYLAANRIDLENVSNEVMQRARYRAMQEAQRNTYRDLSEFANAISKFSKKNMATAILAEGLMPFKKTPINVLKRGVEYSPVGLLKALTYDMAKVVKGDITASEYIDRLCCSLTGTGVVALGMLLKSLGYIVGSSDDDKEKEFEELQGIQNYSLVIGEHSYTLDWLAPLSMPFFVGVELQNMLESEKGINFRDSSKALANITEPFFEMSMLQGIAGAVDTIKAAKSAETFSGFALNAAQNYFGQAVPTLFGQIARTIDDTQRRSYDDKNVDIPQAIQYFVQSQAKKIPGISKTMQPYVDNWGRKKVTDGIFKRAFLNMLSPGYYSKVETSGMEEELKRLYDEVGEEDGMSLFPSAAVKKFNLSDDTEKNLTAEEYTTMQEVQGQSAYKLLTGIIDSEAYAEFDDATKGKIITNTYKLAKAAAKKAVAGDDWSGDKWIEEALSLIDGEDYSAAEDYLMYYTLKNDDAVGQKAARSFAFEKLDDIPDSVWENSLSDSAKKDYEEYIKGGDISIEEYVAAKDYYGGLKTIDKDTPQEITPKEQMIDYIDGLDKSREDKRRIYLSMGYSKKTCPW